MVALSLALIYSFLSLEVAFECLCLPLHPYLPTLSFFIVIPGVYHRTTRYGSIRNVNSVPGKIAPDNPVETKETEDDTLLELRKQLKEKYGDQFPLRENFIKGSGPGGQKVNKSNNCVQLIQYSETLGTNIVVKCHMHRSLLQNRIEATRILLRKLEEAKEEPEKVAKELEEKEKRKILKLSKAEKEQKKFEKQLRSEKKANRQNSRVNDNWF